MRAQVTDEIKRLASEKGVSAITKETGIPRDTLYRIIRGERAVGSQTLERLIRFYPTVRDAFCDMTACQEQAA